jgi:hypothetical protein
VAKTKLESRNPNVEQGISNDELRSSLFFPSAFGIRYSTCPLCSHTDSRKICHSCDCHGCNAPQSTSQGRRVFCGSLLSFYTACRKITG